MPVDSNKPVSKLKGSRRRAQTSEEVHSPPMLRFDSDVDMMPPHVRKRLHDLFSQIEKEFETLYAENLALQERLDAQTERVEATHREASSIDNTDNSDISLKPKRSASQISQKIKTTYKASTSKLVSSFRNSSLLFSVVRKFEGHRDGIWEVMVSRANQPGQQVLGTASADHTARIWSIQTQQCLLQYLGHQGSVNSIRFHPDRELALTSSGDHTAHIWGAHVTLPEASKRFGRAVSVDDDVDNSEKEEQPEAESVEQAWEAAILRTPSMELVGHSGVVVAADWMLEGNQVITASWDRTALLFDAETGEQINSLTGHDQELTDVRTHHSQKLVVTSSKDTTFRLWDFRSPSMQVNVCQGHNQPVTSALFAGSDKVVSGSDDRTVKVWDVKNMRSPLAAIRIDSSVNRLSVSSSQSLIAIPHDNRHIRIYDINGNRIGRLPRSNRQGHSKMVTSVAWTEDHPVCNLFSCGFDRKVLGWNINLREKD
ncbi:WD repeat-containing protein 37-like isoform X2 [Saccostrea echinata]|uniref:WD repeat-containing protein 37-like isoform X2 n=1 Tax=Saccostrea echinata TaxID=191078 RepID=UPI002A834104|nr:WD repeat-containing protein 37-like isoform X2 [Saccostrea echinata]